jgi:SAM-dependent methyltransferase
MQRDDMRSTLKNVSTQEMQDTTAEQHYRGDDGLRYHQYRCCLRSAYVQQTRARFFRDLETDGKTILDFGCGTGGVLANIQARERIGVEINEEAAREAETVLDRVYTFLSEITSSSVDVVISFHALEHVENPAQILREIHRIVKPDGVVRIIVPTEMPLLVNGDRSWRANDPNMHLYTWTPLLLGNLLTVCGFEVEEGRLLPVSEGGRIGALFAEDSRGRYLASFIKALRHGHFQSRVTARKAS